jgi:hypothetical protein
MQYDIQKGEIPIRQDTLRRAVQAPEGEARPSRTQFETACREDGVGQSTRYPGMVFSVRVKKFPDQCVRFPRCVSKSQWREHGESRQSSFL